MLRELGSRTISRSKPGGALSPGQPECVEECVVRVRYGEALCDIEQPSGAEDPADGVGWKPRGDEGTHSLERQRQYPRQHSEARVGPLTGLEFEGLTELTKSSKRASPMSTTQATHNDQASQAAARRFEPPLFRPWLLAPFVTTSSLPERPVRGTLAQTARTTGYVASLAQRGCSLSLSKMNAKAWPHRDW
jgi:hypothetical protein